MILATTPGVPALFDLKAALLAKHAQHVVLIHFPIALFISAVAFDIAALFTNRSVLADVAYYNFLTAALATFPALTTGILAWQFLLEGQKLKGLLLFHLILGCISSLLIWLVWWFHRRARCANRPRTRHYLAIELLTTVIVGMTAHAGGFLSGVSG